MLLVAALAVIGFGLPLAVLVEELYRDEALLTLSAEAARASAEVPASFAAENDTPELPDTEDHIEVALYGADGRLVVGRGPEMADAAVLSALAGAAAPDSDDLIVAYPISDEEIRVGAIRAEMTSTSVTRRSARTWSLMIGWAAVILLAAGGLSAWLSRGLARPIARLEIDAQRIGGGGEIPAREPSGISEIDAVHAALAEAASRLNDALARERAFSADLAHQVRTPLASLRLRLETEQMQGHSPDAVLDEALGDIDRLDQTVSDLLLLARDTETVRAPYSLSVLLRDVVEGWIPSVENAGRELELTVDEQVPLVEASPAAIRQILDVLLDNALRHGDGSVTVAANRIGTGAVIEVADDGWITIDPGRVFVRRQSSANGTGIGLALARRLAEAEGMRLVLVNPGPHVVFHLIVAGISARPLAEEMDSRPTPGVSR